MKNRKISKSVIQKNESPQEKCMEILEKLESDRLSDGFLEPVDWNALGLFSYLEIIKKPMDLGTVKNKLKAKLYENVNAFFDDLFLIWSNCMTFNLEKSVRNFFNYSFT